jgi:hypothetical protein
MTELYRERDFSVIGFHQSILEAEGIATHVRNRDLGTMTTEVPLPDMFPALCVVDDADYERAMSILKDTVTPSDRSQPEPMKPVFLAGVLMIFGSWSIFAVWMLVLAVGSLSTVNPNYVSLVLYTLGILASLWIMFTNVARFRRERKRLKEE